MNQDREKLRLKITCIIDGIFCAAAIVIIIVGIIALGAWFAIRATAAELKELVAPQVEAWMDATVNQHGQSNPMESDSPTLEWRTLENASPQIAPESFIGPEEYTVSQDAEQPGPELVYLGSYQIYGYDTCERCCVKSDGITASGTTATVGRTVAVMGIPFGTRLYIEGIGERVVEDRGGLEPGVIDVLCENHSECYAITGTYEVYVIETPGAEA